MADLLAGMAQSTEPAVVTYGMQGGARHSRGSGCADTEAVRAAVSRVPPVCPRRQQR